MGAFRAAIKLNYSPFNININFLGGKTFNTLCVRVFGICDIVFKRRIHTEMAQRKSMLCDWAEVFVYCIAYSERKEMNIK